MKPKFPKLCLMTFFREVLDSFTVKNNAEKIGHYEFESRKFPIYRAAFKGVEICLVQAVVGSAPVAQMATYLINHGVEAILACGDCGVLNNMPPGDVIIPVSAFHDENSLYEGTTPSNEIFLNHDVISIIKETLTTFNVPFMETKTWTTDAFFSETSDMITYRKADGCTVVEMECATLAAVAELMGIKFGQLLYSRDISAEIEHFYSHVENENLTARDKLFYISLEVLIRL